VNHIGGVTRPCSKNKAMLGERGEGERGGKNDVVRVGQAELVNNGCLDKSKKKQRRRRDPTKGTGMHPPLPRRKKKHRKAERKARMQPVRKRIKKKDDWGFWENCWVSNERIGRGGGHR